MPGVAFPGPGAGGNFLEQILGDLLQLMGGSSPGGARVDLARTLAQGVAAGGEPEGNVDPADRIRFEALAHIAELHVAELTGLPITPSGASLEIAAVGPGAWAWQTVEDWRFLLEAMAEPSAASDREGSGNAPGTSAPDVPEAPRGRGASAASATSGGPPTSAPRAAHVTSTPPLARDRGAGTSRDRPTCWPAGWRPWGPCWRRCSWARRSDTWPGPPWAPTSSRSPAPRPGFSWCPPTRRASPRTGASTSTRCVCGCACAR